MKPALYFILGSILAQAVTVNSYQCDRTPSSVSKPASRVNTDRYVIEISGNPKSYTPGENYTITLKSSPASLTENRFYEFTLVAEPDSRLSKSAGNFHLTQPVLTMFNHDCPNTVTHTNTLAKTSIEVVWRAPSSGSGCVAIKGTVVESTDTWFSDDGELTKTLCEEDEENEDVQPKILETCCACNEAKYEVAFQGLWSRNTHPKDFPEDVWETKLGDVIGASHKYSRSFWNYGGMASPGLKVLAEKGDTSDLETELKEMVQSDDIRTIIKARELSHPKITATSYTVFRVDQENHLISLVSKITPSPDWIVGVANLELCLDNCSWAESRTLNLYPWDVGTDDGITYTSPDLPANDPQLIRRIKSNSPNREESPFYDAEGKPIKPLAKLYLTRQKLYEKECKQVEEEAAIQDICNFGEWSEWSSCSATCGSGVRTRDRPLNSQDRVCLNDKRVLKELQETESCNTGISCSEYEPSEDDCPNTEWGEWTECELLDSSMGCGNGIKTRYRTSKNDYTNEDEEESGDNEEYETPCAIHKQEVQCSIPCPFGDISSDRLIQQGPYGRVVDCKVSKWSIWSPCNTTKPYCKKQYKVKTRHILIHAQNGGKACPRKLQKKKKCRCRKNGDSNERSTYEPNATTEERVDCLLGEWSKWSPCSTTCGYSVRQRTRSIIRYPSKNGAPCGPRIQQKKCPLPLACNDRGMSPYFQ